ncbi:MAG: hypothetical protein GY761_05060 [Hyphomicrobiales bacterium]|nr:hypothetical protein [Hyphomicrobiales bacterium]
MDTIENLDARRQKIGVSQSHLCQEARIHATTYTKLLKGHSKQAQFRTLSKLKKALDYFEAEAA